MVMRESPQADREAIEAIEQAHAIDWHRIGISRGIRECRQCRSIRSYFRTEFNYGNGQRFHSPCACPECGTPGVEWVTPYEALHCTHCNRAGFKPVGFKLMD